MLAKLRAQHKTIAQMTVTGASYAEIAEATGLVISTITKIVKDPLCIAYMDTLNDKAEEVVLDVRKRLANMNSKALDVIEDLLTDEKAPQNLALSAAKDVLDRTGYKPADNINLNHSHMTKEDIIAMRERAVAAGAQLGPKDFFPDMDIDKGSEIETMPVESYEDSEKP